MIDFVRDNARWIIGGFLLTLLSSFGQTFFISLSASELRETFSLSHGEFARLYMLATLASAATLPFVGRLVDVVHVRRSVLLCMPILALACLMMALLPTVWLLVLALFGLRLFGQGMMTHIAMTAMGRWYATQRGRAISLVSLGHQFGEMVLPLAFTGLVALGIGWRSVWVGCAVLLVLVGLPVAARLLAVERTPLGEAPERATASADWTRGRVLRDPVFWVLMVGVLAPAFIGTSLFFHQNYMVELRGWSPVAFAGGFTVMAVVTIIAALVAGRLIDTFGSLALLPYFLLPLAASCVVLALGVAAWVIPAFFALLGASYGLSQTLFGALWPELYGTRHLGAIRSVTVSLMVLSTALGPAVTGTLIDRGISLPEQLVFIAAYCLAASIVLALAARVARRRLTVAVALPAR